MKVYFKTSHLILQLIGTREVPRPSSRVEIVAAMRRIRVSKRLDIVRQICCRSTYDAVLASAEKLL